MLALRHNRYLLRAPRESNCVARMGSLRISPVHCSPISKRKQNGMTLIEIMVAMVVVGILFALGAPNFKNWLQSGQIRTSAESILNGLQIAKGAAVNRNAKVVFQMTNTLDATCAPSLTGTNWIISQNDPAGATGACNAAPSDTVAPFIIQKRSGADGSPNAAANATAASVTFDGLGRANTPTTITVSNPTGGACTTLGGGGGPMRCMNITVTTGGRIRMCDPALPTTDPQGC